MRSEGTSIYLQLLADRRKEYIKVGPIVSFNPELWLAHSLSKMTEKGGRYIEKDAKSIEMQILNKRFSNRTLRLANAHDKKSHTPFKKSVEMVYQEEKKKQICESLNILVATSMREEEIPDGATTVITLNMATVFIYVSVRASHAFVEANFEALKSLIKKQRGQARNEGVRVELEYSSEEYDEEIESQTRLLTLLVRGLRVEPKEDQKKGDKHNEIREQKVGKIKGVNLPPFLAAHLNRNEVGKPLYASLASGYEGTQPSISQ
ncbi:hypothetical protein Tco_0453477 [Tanacetum coccineum]